MLNLSVRYVLINGNRTTNKILDLLVKNNDEDEIQKEAKILIARHERVPFDNINIVNWVKASNH
jgi:hypothetical protein